MTQEPANREIERILVRAVHLGGDGARSDQSVVLSPQGGFGGVEAIRFGKRVEQCLASGARWIIADFAQVTGISGSGIGVLLASAGVARSVEGELCLVRLGSEVRRCLSLVGAKRWFRTANNVEEAVQYYGDRHDA